MHILFIHKNFPAQFGHVAAYLTQKNGYRCTFLSELPPANSEGVERIQYKIQGGSTLQTHYCSRSFENAIWHSAAVFDALKARPDVQPDIVVAHSGFLSTVFLRELYDCPIVNYFEYFYHSTNSDIDFRPDFPSTEINRLRVRARNAHLLLDLENCDIGYSPTRWQRSRFPASYQSKIRTIFDGIDTSLWRPNEHASRRVAGRDIPENFRVVTYVARGMERMRGFDIFMRAAKLISDRRDDVIFVVVGRDRIAYGGDQDVTGGATFKEWVLSRDKYDLSRFLFTGLLPPRELADLLSLSDLHIYLTVPFVVSWSLMNALACGATVLASDTAPVREMITDGVNGILVDFFDVERIADIAIKILNVGEDYRPLGVAGIQMIQERYSMEVCLPRMLALYEEAFYTYHDNSDLGR